MNTSKGRLALLAAAVTLLSGCAGSGMGESAQTDAFESQALTYDSLVVEVLDPAAALHGVALASAGAGAREGAKFMLAAPVGCMQAGMLYGFCLAMAPFFPFLAARAVQDEAVSREQLEALATYIDGRDMPRRFTEKLYEALQKAHLPIREQAHADARSALLQVELGAFRLEHDGNKGGEITVTQPYRFAVIDPAGRTVNVTRGELTSRFDVDEWPSDPATVGAVLDGWVARIADRGLRDALIEWRPRVVLAARFPQSQWKRSIIGINQEFWPFVESTRPRLAWQSLQEVLAPEIMNDVSDVSYELRIGAGYDVPSLYSVTGLSEPEHVVTLDLMPCTIYRWQPLAHFRYRGAVHTSSLRTRPWSKTYAMNHDYLIKTPGPDCKDPAWPQETGEGEPLRSSDGRPW